MELEKDPPVPLSIVQFPLPILGVFPANVALVNPHKVVWSKPAVAVVGF